MKTEVVRSRLSELEHFLEQHHVTYAAQVATVRQRIDTVRAAELPHSERDRVLAMFGGMGSLNDVVISRENGHVVEDEVATNRELERITEQLWQSVNATPP
jgi:hypothetical protein